MEKAVVDGRVGERLSAAETFQLCAQSVVAYGRTFFPRAMPQASPEMHHDMSAVLLNPANQFIGFNCFRGSAKTTMARIYASMRAAYAITPTGLAVGLSQAHAVRTLRWLKRQVEHNTAWASFYGLSRGDKWTDEHIVIHNARFERDIQFLALGITGNTRGVNLDDHRPSFILVDDPCDIENTATKEQIEKTNERFFADLAQSLAPKTENPLSQMVLLQTSLAFGDLIYNAERDPQFLFRRYSCFKEDGESQWPERFPREQLLKMKEGYIRRNQLSMWLREMECTVVSQEDKSMRRSWLNFYMTPPEGMEVVIAIDPASSESKTADFNAIAVVGRKGANRYLLEYHLSRGTMPDECAAKFFEFVQRWGARRARVEVIGYQRVLADLIERKAAELRIFIHVEKVQDRRKKSDRIIQAFTQCAPFGNFHIREGMTDFIEQYERYSPLSRDHDDLLDAVAMALDDNSGAAQLADNGWIEGEFRRLSDYPEGESGPRTNFMGAP